MSQAPDFTLVNQSGAAFRTELNIILQALASAQSGPTEPPLRYAGMLWCDTSGANPVLRMRGSANAGWIVVDPTAFGIGVQSIPAVASADAVVDTGFFRTSTGATGAPLSTEQFRYIHLPGASTAAASQIAVGEATGRLFIRRRASGAWNAWEEINLGPLTVAMFAASAIRTAAEGLAGALDTELATAALVASAVSTSAVLGATAGAAAGAVGTYGMMRQTTLNTARLPGATVAGSNLRWGDAGGTSAGATPSGTWRLVGELASGSNNTTNTSMWLRIS